MGETYRAVRWNDAALDRYRHVCVFDHSHDEEYQLSPGELLQELRQPLGQDAGRS